MHPHPVELHRWAMEIPDYIQSGSVTLAYSLITKLTHRSTFAVDAHRLHGFPRSLYPLIQDVQLCSSLFDTSAAT